MTTKVKLIAPGVITPSELTLTTASGGTNTTAPATTAFVQQEISSLVDSSPGALNTLNELAAALGDDANFSTTVTNSIATKLPLAGGTITGTTIITGTAGRGLVLSNATESYTNNVAVINAQHSQGILQFKTANTERMRIDKDGNVGIGTAGAAKLRQLDLKNTSHSLMAISAGSGGHAGVFYYDGTTEMFNQYYDTSSDKFILSSSAVANQFVIDRATGNVGIGQPSPTHKLHVKKDNDYAAKFGGTGGGDYSIEIGQGTTNSSAGFNATGSSGSMLFKISDSEKMRIKYDGNVGIGTNNPGSKLTVEGDIRQTTGDLLYTGGGNWNIRHLANDQNITFDTTTGSTTSEKMRIRGDGNVGIGTTSLDSITSTVATLSLGGINAGTSGGIAYQTNGTSEAYHYTNADFLLHQALSGIGQRFLTNNTERMRIESGGNVGIGTTSPSHKLHVSSTARFELTNGGLVITKTSGGASTNSDYMSALMRTDTAGYHVTTNNGGFASTANALALMNHGDLILATAPATGSSSNYTTGRVMILAGGNVGVGTAAPTERLHVDGVIASQNSGQGAGQLQLQGYGNSAYINHNGSGALIFRMGSGFSERMRINSSGYLLVGKTNTTFSNHGIELRGGNLGARFIRSNAEPVLMNRVGGDGRILGLYFAGNEIGYLGSNTASGQTLLDISSEADANSNIRFLTYGSSSHNEVMRLTSSGNVGIGTGAPQGMLHVAQSKGSAGNLWSQVGAGNTPSIHIQNTANTANVNAALYFRNSSAEKASIGARFVNQSTGQSELRFSVTNSSGTTRERMTLSGDGTLCIGESIAPNSDASMEIKTAAPNTGVTTLRLTNAVNNKGQRIDFYDDNAARAFTLSHDNGNNITYMGTLVDESFAFYTNSAERMRITNNGNVGIGVTDPGDIKLKVHSNDSDDYIAIFKQTHASNLGTVQIDTPSDSNARPSRLDFARGGVNKWKTGMVYGDTTNGWGLSDATGSGTALQQTRFLVQPGGNVGIGTGSPQTVLDVRNPSDSNQTFRVLFPNSSTVQIGTTRMGSGATQKVFVEGQVGVTFGINGHEKARVHSNGQFGIGTTSPSDAKLDIRTATIGAGSNYATRGIKVQLPLVTGYQTQIASIISGFDSTINSTDIGMKYNGGGYELVFSTNHTTSGSPTQHMVINKIGNVGIGTSNPKRPLQIGATGSFPISFNGNYPDIHFNTYYESGWRVHTAGFGAKTTFNGATGAFGFSNVASSQSAAASFTPIERFTILANGNVGIGTDNPGTKLDVLGNVRVEAGNVWSETTQGQATGSIHIDPGSATDHAGGSITFGASDTSNGTNAQAGIYVRSDGSYGTKMYLSTTDSYGHGSKTAMMIASDGSLNKGTFSSTGGTTGTKFINGEMHSSYNGTGPRKQVYIYNPNGEVGSIESSFTSCNFNTTSDYRLKENVVYDWDATTRLKQLKPARFNFISHTDRTVDGFLAHEVSSVVPEAVSGTKDAMKDEEYEVTPAVEEVRDEEGNITTEAVEAVVATRSVPDMQGIDQSKLIPLLVKTIQELEARIAALES